MEVNIGKELCFLEQLLGNNLEVSVNTKCIGVVLPEWLYAEDSVKLNIGYSLPIPITGLEVNSQGLRCTLSFRRQPFRVQLPWYSVWQIEVMGTTHGWVWPGDMPRSKQPITGIGPSDGPTAEPTTVDELVAGTPAEPKSNIVHVDFKSRRKASIVDAVIEDEKEPA